MRWPLLPLLIIGAINVPVCHGANHWGLDWRIGLPAMILLALAAGWFTPEKVWGAVAVLLMPWLFTDGGKHGLPWQWLIGGFVFPPLWIYFLPPTCEPQGIMDIVPMKTTLTLMLLFADNWPSYRGPGASGVGQGAAPATWNLDASAGPIRGLRWKTPIPGLGHSSPVIWQDRLFVTTAIRTSGEAPLKIGLYGSGDSANDNEEQSWAVYCLDKHSGKVLWRHIAARGLPRAPRHPTAPHANTSLATDGKNLVAFFGSEGLHVWTLDGKVRWKKDLGILDMAPWADRSLSWGFASSPVLHDGVIVVQADAKSNGFAAAFSVEDGRELWRVARESASVGSWATPGVIRAGGRTQIVLNGYPFIAGYDFSTGKELWRLRSEGDVPVPVPFESGGLIFVANAHGGKAPLYAIRPNAQGDISPTGGALTSAGVAWMQERNGSYLQTPVVYEGIVYACTSNGVFKAYDARTGDKFWERRLGDGSTGFTSSPIAAGGKVYVTSEEGETYVIRHGREFELLGKNNAGEIVLSTPAISDEVIFFRTRGYVVAIGR